jgi:methoxymalonate biosynthesis protein
MRNGIKCLVWDLDNTLWRGTLLESDRCRLRPGVGVVVRELDKRGVLQSVASRNDSQQALDVLRRKALAPFFLYPQIGWESKVRAVRVIADRLGIALDAVGLIDDEPFERAQVERLLPGVRAYPAEAYRRLPMLDEFCPGVLSSESRSRRLIYRGIGERERAGTRSGMSQSEFLSWCRTELTIRRAGLADLPRIQELLQRTHQLNATGIVWPPEAIARWLADEQWQVFVAELRDRFVDYGRIGVAACHRNPDHWELVAFLLSCRVLSRGIAGFLLAWVRCAAARDGTATVVAQYCPGPRNHAMERLFRLAGLADRGPDRAGVHHLAGPSRAKMTVPRWLTVHDGDAQ